MADFKPKLKSGGGGVNNLPWFLGILAILWIAWYVTGGTEKGHTDRPLIKPPAPLDSGETYGPSSFLSSFQRKSSGGSIQKTSRAPGVSTKKGTKTNGTTSPVPNTISFSTKRNTQSIDPNKEYLQIEAGKKNTQPITVTGWQIKSGVTGRSVTLGNGSYLPSTGDVNVNLPIVLRPGEKAYIVTGRSPIGDSFRLNMCSGYFEQFQNFTPGIPLVCPAPNDELLPPDLNDACLDYIDRLPRCQALIKGTPTGINDACARFLGEKINYVGCVETHKGDPQFYKPEWRIYLGQNSELWKTNRETIMLLDINGETVDAFSY